MGRRYFKADVFFLGVWARRWVRSDGWPLYYGRGVDLFICSRPLNVLVGAGKVWLIKLCDTWHHLTHVVLQVVPDNINTILQLAFFFFHKKDKMVYFLFFLCSRIRTILLSDKHMYSNWAIVSDTNRWLKGRVLCTHLCTWSYFRLMCLFKLPSYSVVKTAPKHSLTR
jgi:hypothetical protein